MHKMYDIKILPFLNILCEANGETSIVEIYIYIYIYIYIGEILY